MTHHRVVLPALVACLVVMVPTRLEAREHAAGSLYLRVSGGLGWVDSWTEYDASPIDYPGDDGISEYAGRAFDFNVAAGPLFARDFSLHLSVFGWVMPYEYVRDDYRLIAVGPGFTTWALPADLYLSGAVGTGRAAFGPHASIRSDPGIVFDLSIGRDWWIHRHVGLGVMATAGYHRFADNGPHRWAGSSYGIKLSTSFN